MRKILTTASVVTLVAGLLTYGATVSERANAASSAYEAEAATVHLGVVESNHTGFTGSGFVNTDNVVGSYVEFTVNASTAGTFTAAFRYSNGTTAGRAGAVSVNGKAVATPAFPPTPSWDAWAVARLPVPLTVGANRIRVTSTTAAGLANLDSLNVADAVGTDWSDAVVDSTMRSFTPANIGDWNYMTALYMMGQYRVAQRTTDPIRRAALIAYIKSWADRFIDSSGHFSRTFDSLDSMMPGQVMVALYRETGDAKYRAAATQIYNRLLPAGKYPTTSDGGFWHSTGTDRAHQLWSDGTFMADPFVAQYGKYVGDSTQAFDIATMQLVVYASHLQTANGILKHAYDESHTASWADKTTGLSSEYWCRAVGWFGVASVQVLDLIPSDHPRRAQIIKNIQNLAAGLATYQDPASGLWFQVIDKGSRSDNWTETSCSAMFSYTIDTAIKRGYLSAATYQPVVDKGKLGELSRISLHTDGLTYLVGTSIGTNVGDYSYYINRTRATNDFHGLGAFVLFSEQTLH